MKAGLVRVLTRLVGEIILIAVVSAILLVSIQYVQHRKRPVLSTAVMNGPIVTVGSPVQISSLHFNDRPLTLVLVSSPSCHFCLASKDFHKRLLAETSNFGVPLFMVVPDRSLSKSYSSELGFSRDRIKEWKDLSVSVEGTPTLLALNRSGIVSELWLGQLRLEQERAVLELIGHPDGRLPVTVQRTAEQVSDFPSQEVVSLIHDPHVHIIDIRERDHLNGGVESAANIPLEELPFRAAGEISATALNLVDCRTISSDLCDRGVRSLQQQHFRVATIGKGHYHASSCRTTKAPVP